ncbi:MAG: hypothetical protein AMXMBFR84_44850 [Candidatus Hydrogenedentota bacterium]
MLDYTGHPVLATVFIQRVASEGADRKRESHTPVSLETDERGQFHFASVPWGWYAIWAVKDGYADDTVARLTPAIPAHRAQLILRKVGVISGYVIGTDNQPIVGASIAPNANDEREISSEIRDGMEQITREDGSFRFDRLEPIAWTLLVNAEGYAPLTTEAYPVGGPPVTIRLLPGSILTGMTVDDATNAPVADCPFEIGSKPRKAFRTDSTGQFSIGDLAPGMHSLQSKHSDFLLTEASGTVEVMPYGQVTPSVTLRLVMGGTIRGRVTDEATKNGLEGVIIRSSYRAGTTDADGNYEIRGVQPGLSRVVLGNKPKGYGGRYSLSNGKEVSVNVESGQVVDGVDFTLGMGIAVSGQVVDPEGNPVPGALVNAVTWEMGQDQRFSSFVETVEADSDGRFTIPNCPAGDDLELIAETPEACSDTYGPHPVPEEGLTGIILALKPENTGRISGQVVDAMGRPVRARVSARPQTPGSASIGVQTTDSEGHFILTGLAPGEYSLQVGSYEPRGLMRHSAPADSVTLAAGQEIIGRRIVLDESDLLSISGVVSDEEGQPLLGVGVHADAYEGTNQGMDLSKDDGSFEIIGLEDGFYTVYARSNEYESTTLQRISAGTADLSIVMQRQPVITGIVTDSAGLPVPGIKVVAVESLPGSPAGPPELPSRRNPRTWSDTTKGDGSFAITGLSKGMTVSIAIASETYSAAPLESVESGTQNTRLVATKKQ